jgi:hypothetical protein
MRSARTWTLGSRLRRAVARARQRSPVGTGFVQRCRHPEATGNVVRTCRRRRSHLCPGSSSRRMVQSMDSLSGFSGIVGSSGTSMVRFASIGRITLADLTGKRLQACFSLLARQRTRNGTPIAPATVDRVRDTAGGPERRRPRGPPPRQPARSGPAGQAGPAAPGHLDRRAGRGLAPRRHPPAGRRLDAAAAHHLPHRSGERPARRLVVADRAAWPAPRRGRRTGPRRLGLRGPRADHQSAARRAAGELYCGPPKSRASYRTIALDEDGTRRLVDQAVRQATELLKHQFTDQRRSDARTRTGPGWRRGRPMFTYADGRPIRPEYLTHRFRQICKELGLPPIRLHDLRH